MSNNKSTELPVTNLEEIYDFYNDEYEACELNVGGKTLSVQIKPLLSLKEGMDFVNSVVNSCISECGYFPETVEYLIKSNVLSRYANFKIPKDTKEEHKLVSGFPESLYNEIKNHINKEQLAELSCAIYDCIEFEKSKIASRSKLDELFETIVEVVGKIGDAIDINMLNRVLEKVSNMNEGDILQAISKAYEKNNIVPIKKE